VPALPDPHARYAQQAAWTRSLRAWLSVESGLDRAARILEVGCGTGAILAELPATARRFGIDIDPLVLPEARRHAPSARLSCADALCLPLKSASVDAVLCHFLLLWVSDPVQALREMRRVTRPGGVVMAFAEPDYGGRIDHPLELVELGHLQGQALQTRGADPLAGRKLGAWFTRAGLADVQVGVMGGQWGAPPTENEWQAEWSVLQADLAGQIPADRLAELRALDSAAWAHGERILFVPTFYAWGRVPLEELTPRKR